MTRIANKNNYQQAIIQDQLCPLALMEIILIVVRKTIQLLLLVVVEL